MRLRLSIFAISLTVFTACNKHHAHSGSNAISSAVPTFVRASPADGANVFSIPSNIAVTFSVAVAADTDAFTFDAASTCDTLPNILSVSGAGTTTVAVNLDTNGVCTTGETLIFKIDMSLITSSTGNVPGMGNSSVTLTNRFFRIFIQGLGSDGNLGGAAGADAFCMQSNGGINDGHTFKALLTDSTRRACTTANCSVGGTSEHLDWVFAPNTAYVRSDDTTFIGNTDANGLLIFPITQTIDAAPTPIWTGLNANWTSNSNNCNNWSSNSSGLSGEVGLNIVNSFGTGVISNGTDTCDTPFNESVYCVEQ